MILDGVTLGAPVAVHMCQEAGVAVTVMVEAIVTGAGGPHRRNGFRMFRFKP
jgi:hypothetical protein